MWLALTLVLAFVTPVVVADVESGAANAKTFHGRYLRLERTDQRNAALNLLEIEVYDCRGRLIDPVQNGFRATLGPQYGSAAIFGPQFLIDGKKTTWDYTNGGLASTSEKSTAFMEIDLGAMRYISAVVIYNRIDCCRDRIIGTVLSFRTSDQTIAFKYPINTVALTYRVDADAIGKPRETFEGRYLRIARADGRDEYMNWMEMEVYGEWNERIDSAEFTATLAPQYGSWGPANLIDGNKSTMAVTSNAVNGFMEIDMGRVRRMSRVVVINRQDCCQDRAVGTQVTLRTNDQTRAFCAPITTATNVYELTAETIRQNACPTTNLRMIAEPFA